MEREKNTINVHFGESNIELDITGKIGEGAFASVFRASDIRGNDFAVKKVLCQSVENHESVSQEVSVLLRIQHPHIIKMYALDFVDQAQTAVLVMEYCENGTLNTYLGVVKPSPEVSIKWMTQMASALEHLHSHDIVHRDLKPDNILVTANDDVKISDFGVARSFTCLHSGVPSYDSSAGYLSEYLDRYMGTFAGTPYWIAPEVFDHVYDEKADIFSLGIIFYAISEGQSCMHEGKQYFGCFIKQGNQDVGIGAVMAETKVHIEPIFSEMNLNNRRVNEMIAFMLHLEPNMRPDSQLICSELNEAHAANLTKEEELIADDNLCTGMSCVAM